MDIVNLTPDKNYISPDFTKPYQPKQASIEHFSWVNTVFEPYPTETPKMHYQIIDHIASAPKKIEEDTLTIRANIVVHREGAKTTVATQQTVMKAAMTGEFINIGEVTNIVIFSETKSMAMDILADIYNMWESSEALYTTVPLAKKRNGKYKGNTLDHYCFVAANGNHVHIQAKGAGEGMRGTKKDGERPQVIILDDILGEDQLTSKQQRKKTIKWFYSVVVPATSSKKNMILSVGTPMTEDDLITSMLYSEAYHSMFLPICQNWNEEGIDLIPNWRGLHPAGKIYNDFKEAKEMDAENEFYREKLLQFRNENMRIFKDEYFPEYSYNELKHRLYEMNIYTSMDLAVSQKQHNDYTVVITVAVDKEDNWYIIDIGSGKLNPRQTINELFRQVERFRPMMMKAEKAALQQVLDWFIMEEMSKTGIYFPYEGLKNNSTLSKEYRIIGLQPKMQAKKIFFPRDIKTEEIKKLKAELKGFTKEGATTKNDDHADCLANFLDPDFLKPPTPARGSEVRMSEDFMDEYKSSY